MHYHCYLFPTYLIPLVGYWLIQEIMDFGNWIMKLSAHTKVNPCIFEKAWIMYPTCLVHVPGLKWHPQSWLLWVCHCCLGFKHWYPLQKMHGKVCFHFSPFFGLNLTPHTPNQFLHTLWYQCPWFIHGHSGR